jgi:hypothetical protein
VPAAAGNAWARLIAPWNVTPRYTFAALEPLPETIVVPHGEPFTVAIRLAEGWLWHPQGGQVHLGEQQPVPAPLRDNAYRFQLPAQIEPVLLHVAIGDARYGVQVEPVLRPELTSVLVEVHLPDYLGRTEPVSV